MRWGGGGRYSCWAALAESIEFSGGDVFFLFVVHSVAMVYTRGDERMRVVDVMDEVLPCQVL